MEIIYQFAVSVFLSYRSSSSFGRSVGWVWKILRFCSLFSIQDWTVLLLEKLFYLLSTRYVDRSDRRSLHWTTVLAYYLSSYLPKCVANLMFYKWPKSIFDEMNSMRSVSTNVINFLLKAKHWYAIRWKYLINFCDKFIKASLPFNGNLFTHFFELCPSR